MKQTFLLAVLLNIFLTSCMDRSGAASPQEPVYLVDVEGQSDEVTIQNQGQSTVIEIHSVTGIGNTTFKLESGDLPDALTVHLYLAGLEEFRLSSEHTTIAASFSSGSVFNNDNQRIILPGEERAITSGDPMWLDIRIVSSEPVPSLPLQAGYFEIVFPREFIEESGDSFKIQWIDFYR